MAAVRPFRRVASHTPGIILGGPPGRAHSGKDARPREGGPAVESKTRKHPGREGMILRPRAGRALSAEWLSYGRLYVARLAGLVVAAVLTVASARVLQPEGRGEFVTVSAMTVVGAQVLNLGLSSSLLVLFSRRPRRIGRHRLNLVYVALAWGAVLTLLGALASTFVRGWSFTWWPFWAAWIPLQLLGLYQGAALFALQDAKALSALEFIGRCFALVLGGVCLFAFADPIRPFLAAVILADGLVALLGARRLARVAPGTPTPVRRAGPFFRAALVMGLRAHPPLVLLFLVVKSDLLVLRLLRGAVETGIYSVASQVVDIALMLPKTIAALAFASVARAARPAAELLRILRPTGLVIGALAVALAIFGHWGIVLLFGRSFEGAYPALVLLLPGFVFMGLQSLLGQYFASRGFPMFMSYYWLLGLGVNLALNFLFVPAYGALAAAASSSVTYALVFLLMARRFLRDRRVEG
jgi:O-antigen/teichoic acid export membrane protein